MYHIDILVPSIPVHTGSLSIDLYLDQSQKHSVQDLYSCFCSGTSFLSGTNNIHLHVIIRILNILVYVSSY